MKAVVWHGIGDIRLDEVPEPDIQHPNDAVVRITASAICGTDLHMIRGTMGPMRPGTILGHEGVGVIEKLGRNVRNFQEGQRVVIPSTVACGHCSYCRAGVYSQCDNANPNGAEAGLTFFGGPETTGPLDGLQAEKARIPYANAGLVTLPDSVDDDDALLISDIFPTGYFAADVADVRDGRSVAVFGCGPVGLFSIMSAQLMGAGRILAVDNHPDRLDLARELGAEAINFDDDDPVEAIKELTGGIGTDRVIDAVGVDAEPPRSGPAAARARQLAQQFAWEVEQIMQQGRAQGEKWQPGRAPSQVLRWAVEAVAKAGTIALIGAYPPPVCFFPLGKALHKNLRVHGGNCNHRKYIPKLVNLVASGVATPKQILSNIEPLSGALEAYESFDRRSHGWIKVELEPAMVTAEV